MKTNEMNKSEDLSHKTASPRFCSAARSWYKDLPYGLKESTMVKYYNIVENHLIPYFEGIHVDAVDRYMLEKFVSDKLDHGRLNGKGGLEVKTVKDMLSVIHDILQYANGYANTFRLPANLWRQPAIKKCEVLSQREQQVLEHYLWENINFRNIGIMLSLYMGLRIGEVCALRWKNINLMDGYIHVESTLQRLQNRNRKNQQAPKTILVLTPPKSSCSIRDIPIPESLQKVLSADGQFDRQNDNFLLSNSDCRYVEPRLLQYEYKKILQKCNLSYSNFHVLRHTFATRCVEAGFDIRSLSEILGHSDVNITMNRYVHSSFSWKQKNMQLIEQWCSINEKIAE